MYGTWQAVATQHRRLRRLAVEGAFTWLVVHAAVAGGSHLLGAPGMAASVRAGIVVVTAVALWADLRASRDFLFHANLGLGGRVLMAAGLFPGVLGEILLHARQVGGA